METLFTFGSSRQFPFQYGYLIINARNEHEAITEFRLRYPDVHEGIINCADWYSKSADIERFKSGGNLGTGPHAYFNLFDTGKLSGLLYTKGGLDTYDTVFDIVVTTEYISPQEFYDNRNDSYYQFCKYFYDNIDVVDPQNDICDYTGFVNKHYDYLRKFEKKNWARHYPDNDDFCEAWIKEFHGYLAGMATEESYKDLLGCLKASEQHLKATQQPQIRKDEFVR